MRLFLKTVKLVSGISVLDNIFQQLVHSIDLIRYDRYLFYISMNDAEGLMYMKKDDIETGGDWKQVFE